MKYVATVQLVVDADTPDEAADVVSSLMTGVGETNEFIEDWRYAKFDGQFLHPTQRTIPTDTEGNYVW